MDDDPRSTVASHQQKPVVPACPQESTTVSETKEQNETKSSSDQPDSQTKTLPEDVKGENQTNKIIDDSAPRENTAKGQQAEESEEKKDDWGPDESEQEKSSKYVEFLFFRPKQKSVQDFSPSVKANSLMKFSVGVLAILYTQYLLCSYDLYYHFTSIFTKNEGF